MKGVADRCPRLEIPDAVQLIPRSPYSFFTAISFE